MKKVFWITVALLWAVAPMAAQTPERSYIEVTGSNTVRVLPDMIYLEFTIDERVTKGRTELEEVEKNMIEALEGLGIDTKKELKLTASESSTLKKKKLLSYKNYSLIAKDGESVALIFDALKEVGITSMRIVKTTHSRLKELQSEARKNAMLDAVERATELAGVINQEVGKAFYIRDNGRVDYYEYTPRVMYAKGINSAVNEDMAIEEESAIESKEIEIRYEVYVKFELN